MANWAVYLGWHVKSIFQSVVTFIEVDSETVKITVPCLEETYIVPIKDIRKIDTPEYIYGDVVSPINHLELLGVIDGIGYYFKTTEPCYSITIDGKRKSKRYFKRDLIRRN